MGKKLIDLDKNFVIQTVSENDEFDYYDIRKEPFKIYGLYNPETEPTFKRLPDDVASSVSEGVAVLCRNTSGGRIRFKTNSKRVALRANITNYNLMPHMAMAGCSGFDLYIKKNGEYQYTSTFLTEWGTDAVEKITRNGGYENVANIQGDGSMQDITINFPLYQDIDSVYIGIEKGSKLDFGDEYKDVLPTVYYGSSITQGGCASRPGNNYTNVLSRRHDIDFYNFGFSGNAKGEVEMAEYIANIPMSCFVYCYDHNAPTAEHLRNTHENMYNIIREKNPDIPVIFKTRPKVRYNADDIERRKIVYATYEKAKKAGHNVYFIDGEQIFEILGGDSGSVDGCHPNDLGFMCIAESIDKYLKEIYK